jgi:hypothetical protein
VDWNNLLSRMAFYRSEEQAAVQRWQETHKCNLDRMVEKGVN